MLTFFITLAGTLCSTKYSHIFQQVAINIFNILGPFKLIIKNSKYVAATFYFSFRDHQATT